MTKKRSIGIWVIGVIQTVEWATISLGYVLSTIGHSAKKSSFDGRAMVYISMLMFILAYGYICLGFLRLQSKARIGMMALYAFLTPFLLLFAPNFIFLLERILYGAWFYWYLTRKNIKLQFIK